MAYELDKSTGDIVVNGFEQGIQASPHKGIANIQNANISTEIGEVIPSYVRIQDTMTNTASTGTLSFLDSSHVNLSISGTNNLFKGNWITVTGSSNTTQLPNGTYYVPPSTGSGFQLQNYYSGVTFTLPVTASYLIVGGGAAGGTSTPNANGGGGGGGQVSTGSTSLTAGSYTITVGATSSTNGNTSSAFSNSASGGLVGVSAVGSNGGGGGNSGSGKAGGGGGGGTNGGGGGGGGDSTAGTSGASSFVGGNGGNGTTVSLNGITGIYGGGGGGGNSGSGGGSTGGAGGGTGTPGTAGGTNTGGGGGGGGTSAIGGNGGSGIIAVSYPTGSIIGATGGTITYVSSGGVSYNVHTFTSSGTFVVPTPPVVAPLTGFTTGLTATIQMVATIGKPIASATEWYYSSGTPYNRYYILDSNNLVWVYDTRNETIYSSTDNVNWFLPDYQTGWCTAATGIGVISGYLVASTSTGLYSKSVALLGNTNSQSTTWMQFPDVQSWIGLASSTSVPHFAYIGHQGNMYITDGAYIANMEPISSIADATGAATSQNVQSFCSWTTSSPTIGLFSVISGTGPSPSDFPKRVPVVFFTPNTGTLPASITANTVYYINASAFSFQVYSASTGGIALDIQTGSSGVQYFNTFYPQSSNTDSGSSTPLYYWQNQRMSLPVFEISQCMAEVGNTIVIGCRSSILYPWDQVQNLPGNIIPLPESNTVNITTVNQMGYVFTGNKGNVYITDGNVASSVTTVPDYTAGIPGTPASYIDPVFSWGASMYLRGRVYFSLIDQTSIKAGNGGGVWSFTPTQNLYIGQDVGISLRLENQNSYGTYNGTATVLIPKVNQNAIAPQYFSGWESSITSPLYGIDATGTTFAAKTVLEIDAIPTGTMLDKRTFEQIEVKLSTPLLTGDTLTINYRKNLTDVWTSCGSVQLQKDRLSGYVAANFEKSQWLQLQVILNSTSSFIRLAEIRIR